MKEFFDKVFFFSFALFNMIMPSSVQNLFFTHPRIYLFLFFVSVLCFCFLCSRIFSWYSRIVEEKFWKFWKDFWK